jgi:formamidopyrimidine-DNA glycosylase
MPEAPDVEAWCAALRDRVLGVPLLDIRLVSPFLLRTVEPSPQSLRGRPVRGVRRMGKRVVIELDGPVLCVHPMVSGRLRWGRPGAAVPGRIGLASFDFPGGSLLLTEASPKKRAALHLFGDAEAARALDAGGVEPLSCSRAQWEEALAARDRTRKRALTDPSVVAGVGNAFSDEILHHARLSPVRRSAALDAAERDRLWTSTREVLRGWTDRLVAEAHAAWPDEVRGAKEGMAVHGRYGLPCPACGSPVQRILRTDHECCYCATCQCEGRVLADRGLSRLLHDDWPKTLTELEERAVRTAPRPWERPRKTRT